MRLTRRDILASAFSTISILIGLSRSAAASISYTVRNTFLIPEGEIRSPNQFSYDMFEWSGSSNNWGVLEFEKTNGNVDYAEFGNDNYPSSTPSKRFQLDFPTQTSLPMSLNLYSMNIGVAITLVGLHGVLLGGVHLFKNYAAGIMWGIALVLLILSGLLDIGLEIYWLSIVFTAVLLISGLVVRWSR